MKNLRKKLLVSMIAIMCALVCLGTSTFAWFSLIKTAKVNAFTGEIIGEGFLQVSIEKDAEGKWINWSEEISSDDMKDFIDELFENGLFKPVTTDDGETFIDMNGNEATKNVDYLQFTFGVRTSVAKQNIYLVAKDSKVEGTAPAEVWKSDKTVEYEINDEDKGLVKGEEAILLQANAMRIKFEMVWGEEDADKNVVYVANGAELDAEGKGYASHASATAGLAKAYADARHMNLPEDLPAPIADSDVIFLHDREKTLDPATADKTIKRVLGNVLLGNTEEELSAEEYEINATTGETAKVSEATITVTMWLEGWDDNCINGIVGGKFSYAFILSTDAEDDVYVEPVLE